MIDWPVAAASAAGAGRIIVVDAPGEPLREHLAAKVDVVVQPQPNGTAGAVRAGVDLVQQIAAETRQGAGGERRPP
jgi:bifunctional UDP-N-acetylglucosamine pyrophosphorylase/glucosamine-1-phosphate N-acetyltransferase